MADPKEQPCVLCDKVYRGKDPYTSLKRHMWEVHQIRLQVNRVFSYTQVTETVVATSSVNTAAAVAAEGLPGPSRGNEVSLPSSSEATVPVVSFDDLWLDSYLQELVATSTPVMDESASAFVAEELPSTSVSSMVEVLPPPSVLPEISLPQYDAQMNRDTHTPAYSDISDETLETLATVGDLELPPVAEGRVSEVSLTLPDPMSSAAGAGDLAGLEAMLERVIARARFLFPFNAYHRSIALMARAFPECPVWMIRAVINGFRVGVLTKVDSDGSDSVVVLD